MPTSSSTARGFAFALAAYLAWGFFPAYWKQRRHVPALELVAHRVAWSFAFVAILLTARRAWPDFVAVLADARRRRWLLASTALISVNWLLFVVAVNGGHVTQASLGYYINPLLNVLLARAFLGERLRRPQVIAVTLAAAGVVNLAVAGGEVPWLSLALALTFALYGLVRKQAPVEPLTGLAVETGLVTPLALALLAPGAFAGTTAFAGAAPSTAFFLVASGAATALPLLWFAIGARALRYSTLGIVQYLAPTCQLGLAVLVYGEPFTRAHALTFACIWGAVLLYAADALLAQRRAARLAATAAPGEARAAHAS